MKNPKNTTFVRYKTADLADGVKLMPHQQKAVDKFIANKGQGLFFHSTGSGKTIASLGAIEAIKAQRPLILTPASLQKNYTDSIKSSVHPNSQAKYNVMSLEKFRMNPEKHMAAYNPDLIAVDEFQKVKDPKGLTYRALMSIRPKVNHFLSLSATPIQNNPTELYPQLNLVSNGKIKLESPKEFEKEHIKLKKVYPKGIAGILARFTGRYGEKKMLTNTDSIKKETGPYIDKNDMTGEFKANFPEEIQKNVEVPMTPGQQKMYDYFMKKDLNMIDRWRVRHDLPPKAKDSGNFFSRLSSGRQVSNTPSVFSKSMKDPVLSSGKMMEATKRLSAELERDPTNKVVIYSNFTQSGLSPIQKYLNDNKIEHGLFSGDVTKKDKAKAITDFNSGKKRVLLLSPSGAEGLDLKGVSLMQNIDPNWNPAKLRQIYARAVRYKSHAALPPEKRKVNIENYVSTKKPGMIKKFLGIKPETSIDQYIYNRAHEKEDLNNQMNDILG